MNASSHHQTREDQTVRNIAFSIMLGALALLQVAVVVAELKPRPVQVAAVEPARGETETAIERS